MDEMTSLDQLEPGDLSADNLESPQFFFDFVPSPQNEKPFKLVLGMVNACFGGDKWHAPHPSEEQYVVIKGASGYGKTRLGQEVALQGTECAKGLGVKAHTVFHKAGNVCPLHSKRLHGGPGDGRLLAALLLRGFMGNKFLKSGLLRAYQRGEGPHVDDVRKAITAATGCNLLFLQIDEYATDVHGTAAVLSACSSMLDQPIHSDTVFVIPIVTGITSKVDTGLPTNSAWSVSSGVPTNVFVLGGLWPDPEALSNLKTQLCRQLSAEHAAQLEKSPALERILVDLGGHPRFYEWLYYSVHIYGKEKTAALVASGEFGADIGRELHSVLVNKVSDSYSNSIWVKQFVIKMQAERIHIVEGIAKEALRMLLTFALSGVPVDPDASLVTGAAHDDEAAEKIDITFREAESYGFFSLRSPDSTTDTAGSVVEMPLMMAVGLSRDGLAFCAAEELHSFEYSRRDLRNLAVTSLRLRANAFFYRNKSKPVTVPLSDLRPGARLNAAAGHCVVHIPSAVPGVSTLTAFLKDETVGEPQDTGPKQERLWNGTLITVGRTAVTLGGAEDCVAVKTRDTEPVIGGMISFPGTLLVVAHCSPAEAEASSTLPGTGPRPQGSCSVQALQAVKDIRFKAGMDVPVAVVDVFTLQGEGGPEESTRGDQGLASTEKEKWDSKADEALVESAPVVVTTRDCFASVVGPVLALRLPVLDMPRD